MKVSHQKFCEGILSGLSQTAAYAAAFPRAGKTSARINGSKLFRKPSIQAAIASLRIKGDTMAGSVLLTLVERRAFLARLVRARPGESIADSDLCKDVESARNSVGIRLRDKLLAIKLDHDLAGPSQDDAHTAESQMVASIRELVHRIRTSPYLPDGTPRCLPDSREAAHTANAHSIEPSSNPQ